MDLKSTTTREGSIEGQQACQKELHLVTFGDGVLFSCHGLDVILREAPMSTWLLDPTRQELELKWLGGPEMPGSEACSLRSNLLILKTDKEAIACCSIEGVPGLQGEEHDSSSSHWTCASHLGRKCSKEGADLGRVHAVLGAFDEAWSEEVASHLLA